MNQKQLEDKRGQVRKRLSDLAVELEENRKKLEESKANLEIAREETRKLRQNIPIMKSEIFAIECEIDKNMRHFAMLTFKIEGFILEEKE